MTDPKKPDPKAAKNAAGKAVEDDWADAMNEQETAEPDAAAADPWAEALAEQETPAASEAQSADERVFKPLDKGVDSVKVRDLEMIMDIPVKFTVELGRTRITIKQLLELAQGSVVELDGLAGEPMDILINGYLIAQGEVVVVEDRYGIRITEIITPSERVQKLNR